MDTKDLTEEMAFRKRTSKWIDKINGMMIESARDCMNPNEQAFRMGILKHVVNNYEEEVIRVEVEDFGKNLKEVKKGLKRTSENAAEFLRRFTSQKGHDSIEEAEKSVFGGLI